MSHSAPFNPTGRRFFCHMATAAFCVDGAPPIVEPEPMSGKQGKPATAPTRRNWLGFCSHAALGTSATTLLWPLSRYLLPLDNQPETEAPSTLILCRSEEVAPNQARTALYQGRPTVVLRLDDNLPRAFDAVCTHLGCTVLFDPEKMVLHCPCHGAEFDPSSGAVLRGPATRALSPIPVQVRNDTIVLGH